MTRKMQVAMVEKFGEPLVLREWDIPAPGAGQIVISSCITVRGSFVGNRKDMAEALAFGAEGKVHADIELQPLAAINQVFDRLAHGDVASRVVLDFRAQLPS